MNKNKTENISLHYRNRPILFNGKRIVQAEGGESARQQKSHGVKEPEIDRPGGETAKRRKKP